MGPRGVTPLGLLLDTAAWSRVEKTRSANTVTYPPGHPRALLLSRSERPEPRGSSATVGCLSLCTRCLSPSPHTASERTHRCHQPTPSTPRPRWLTADRSPATSQPPPERGSDTS